MQTEAHDMQAREAAVDRERSFIVQAPAGSGKTELLIQRYLALLAAVDAPEEILAITFTRKAAAEMRVRVLGALHTAGGPDAEQPHRRQTQQLAREALQRDEAKEWSLRDQPGRMRILTIDALNGWLARQMPWLSGLGPLSAVSDDAGLLYRDAVRAVLLGDAGGEAVRQAVRHLLVHLDNRFIDIEDLLTGMLAIRDQWIGLVEEGIDGDAARAMLEGSLRRIVTAHLQSLTEHFDPADLDESSVLAAYAARTLAADAERDAGSLAACLDAVGAPSTAPSDLPRWLGHCRLLLTDAGEFRKPKGITVRQGFTPGDPMKPRLLALLDRLRENEDLRALLAATRGLPAARFDETQWDIVGSIVTILNACVTELRAQFTRGGGTDHIEVAASARRALGGELDPTELALLLEYRIRHILVDEFQDTSAGQFELLEQLTAGWSAPDRHTLFLVGDPMQSIYRFREAEVGLFLQVWQQRRLGSVPLEPLLLSRNFRSQQGIVDWVNTVFPAIMPARSDAAAGAVCYAPSIGVRPSEDASTDISIIYSGDRTEEARHIAARLRRVLDGEECGEVGSVAVLVRSRGHLVELMPALRSEGLRFRAVDFESLGNNPAVRDLLALLRAILYPADRIAWLSVLRAPYCGLTLADLHALCSSGEGRPVRDLLADRSRLALLSEDGRGRAGRVAALLELAIGRRGRMSLRALAESSWIALGAPALLDAADVDAARAFLSLLEQHDLGGGLDDVALLEERAALLYAPPDPEGDARLQLMTIHKAKGLEFDVVVLPRLDGVPRRESDRLLLWDRVVGPEGMEFLIAPLRQRGSDDDATYRYIRASRAGKAEHESVRLLYVAATRARRRLLLSATMKEKDQEGQVSLRTPITRSFLSLLWPLVEDEIRSGYNAWQETGEHASETARTVTPGVPLRRVPTDWTPPCLPEDARSDAGTSESVLPPAEMRGPDLRAGRMARAVGVVVHDLLARIASEGEEFWTATAPAWRASMIVALLRDAGLHDAEADAVERVASAVNRTLDDEQGRWLLLRKHASAVSELSLTGVEEHRVVSVRIDRSFVTEDGTRWIVDFKTSYHEGAGTAEFIDGQTAFYRGQLERYARILRKWDGRPVRAALYFPLLQVWREVAVSDGAVEEGAD